MSVTELTWDELKALPGLIKAIDWEITPREAFEAYQLKSIDAWKNRNLPEAVYFYLSTWRGDPRVLLVRRTYVDSQDLAEAPAPAELVAEAVRRGEGLDMPRGQLPLTPELKAWLKAELSQ